MWHEIQEAIAYLAAQINSPLLMLAGINVLVALAVTWPNAMYRDNELGRACRDLADDYMSPAAGLTWLLAFIPATIATHVGHALMVTRGLTPQTAFGLILLAATIVAVVQLERSASGALWRPPSWADYRFQRAKRGFSDA